VGNFGSPFYINTSMEYQKDIKVLEGPWEKKGFPNGEEQTDVQGVISKTITTMYKEDGYLCECTVVREYRNGGDYWDTTANKRIMKLDE